MSPHHITKGELRLHAAPRYYFYEKYLFSLKQIFASFHYKSFFYSCAQGKSFIDSIKEHLVLLLIGKGLHNNFFEGEAFVLTV